MLLLQFKNAIVRTTALKRENRLHIFTLKQHIIAGLGT